MPGTQQNTPPFTAGIPAPENVQDLLPASFRTKMVHIEKPSKKNLFALELLVPRIDKIQSWLWLCGRPMPPRPLHKQIVMDREIVVTEDVEMHLVWAKQKIYIKPLPRWLLDDDFWTTHLGSATEEVRQAGRGFLFLYCALIAYESDFRIARDKGLLPGEVSWAAWKQLSAEVMEAHDYSRVGVRYRYGELRLGRLNKVYILRLGHVFRGYSSVGAYRAYQDLLRDQFSVLASVLAYVAIVLTAMQLGIGVDRLKANAAFQDASYSFVVFSIAGPLGAVALILLVTAVVVAYYWYYTKQFEAMRFKYMKVDQEKENTAERTSTSRLGSREELGCVELGEMQC